jgi:hypothetical protein
MHRLTDAMTMVALVLGGCCGATQAAPARTAAQLRLIPDKGSRPILAIIRNRTGLIRPRGVDDQRAKKETETVDTTPEMEKKS